MSFELGLRCRHCGKQFPSQPLAGCDECFAPLEVHYDLAAIRRAVRPADLGQRPHTLWRYRELLPVPQVAAPQERPVGGTPLLPAPRLAQALGIREIYLKNDAVNFPTLSFKDRVVAVALSKAREFGFRIVACSSTGNLANALAAGAAAEGLEAYILTPADLEEAKIAGTLVFGARLIKFQGNYDQVNRLCSELAQRYPWGIVNVNLRPYYAEGSKTVGYEIAEQLGWRLPGAVVCPMAGGSLIGKIATAFSELCELGWVAGPGEVRMCGAQATGCSPISQAVKRGQNEIEPQRPQTLARSLAIGNPADGFYAARTIRQSGGWADDATDAEITAGMRLLAQTEGVFGETAAGVTVAVARKLCQQGRFDPERPVVLVITGNGLKTLDAVAAPSVPVPILTPKLRSFEAYLATPVPPAEVASAAGPNVAQLI
ncbi:MAG TPA: threonine synthase [Terriglobales bacterium]|nr:threonine synthase [Terriglobales bacterium]